MSFAAHSQAQKSSDGTITSSEHFSPQSNCSRYNRHLRQCYGLLAARCQTAPRTLLTDHNNSQTWQYTTTIEVEHTPLSSTL